MAMWPFGRRTRRNSAGESYDPSSTRKDTPAAGSRPENPRASTAPMAPPARPSRGQPPRHNTLPRARSNAPPLDEMTALPPVQNQRKKLQRRTAPEYRGEALAYNFRNSPSHMSLPADQNMPPTLRGKRTANDPVLVRRMSSKKRKKDRFREEEIKAMSSSMPGAKYSNIPDVGPLRRETKKVHNGLNRHLERPTSEISLPLPESMHSSTSSGSDRLEFKVRALDVFTPRPTIRLSNAPKHGGSLLSQGLARSDSKREKRPAGGPEQISRPTKRINELADDLDAGAIRELMDRDKRRREQKDKVDQERLQRKLQRKAQEQQAVVPDPDLDRGRSPAPSGGGVVVSHDAIVVRGSEEASEVHQAPSSESPLPDKSNQFLDPFSGTAVTPGTAETPLEEGEEEPVVATAKAVRLSQASMSPPTSPRYHSHARGPSNISQLTELRHEPTPEIQDQSSSDRRSSDTSSRRVQGSGWTALFRRSGTKAKRRSVDQGTSTGSEFTNTSRDSLARRGPPPAPVRHVRKTSSTPMRTQSRFREDLPEFPISPPASRVQSPEAASQNDVHQSATSIASIVDRAEGNIDPRSSEAPSPEAVPPSAVLSRSLASIDSEGSWLSGRPMKRMSQQTQPLRESTSTLQREYNDFSDSGEELGVAEDEYFSRLSPPPESRRGSRRLSGRDRKPSSTALADSDDEQIIPQGALTPEQGTLYDSLGRQPTVVHQSSRAKSREGLLNEFQAADESGPSSPHTDVETPGFEYPTAESPFVDRATSVDLGKGHIRHISAGSARLLDVGTKSSTDQKRLSSS